MINTRGIRAALNTRERVTRRELTSAYRVVERGIWADIQELAGKIAARRNAGLDVPISWLYEQERLPRLLQDVRGKLHGATPGMEATITKAVDGAQDLAVLDARRLARDNRFHNRIRHNTLGEAIHQAARGGTRHWLNGLPDQVAEKVGDAFIRNVATGQGPRALARDLQKAVGLGRHRAQTVARTELHRTYRETSRAEWMTMKDVVAGWTWLSSLDPRTCLVCVAMHGSEHPVEQPMETHPSCRCVMAPIPRDASLRDPATPGQQLFDGWPQERKLQLVGPTRLQLIERDGLRLTDLVEGTRHPAYGAGRRVAPLHRVTATRPVRRAA